MRAHELLERYINAVGFDDQALATKQKYKDAVWTILQQSYAAIGGIKGNGFSSPEEMIKKIPMWKIAIRDGQVRAVVLYKDKNGRKTVAVGTDGSQDGSDFVNDIFKNEITRSYGEKSKSALGKMMKLIPWNVLEPYVISPDRVIEMNPHDSVIPIVDIPEQDWPADACLTLSKYPMLKDYGYLRDIGGNMVFKIMIGSPGISIK